MGFKKKVVEIISNKFLKISNIQFFLKEFKFAHAF